MQKRLFTWLVFAAVLCFSSAATLNAADKAASGTPDAAYMKKILDAWVTLDTSKVAPYYAQGPGHTFFDLAPLKYNSWDEYAAGVNQIGADLKNITLALNDDAVVHLDHNLAWGTATGKAEFIHKSGKRDLFSFRWTVIWEKQDRKWVIVHDHFSEPTQ